MVGKTVAHYCILEKLGEGGMGVVYKARDTHLDRFIAIKVLPPEKVADPERKRRFVQEAKAASALNHPSIIHIYDIDHQDGLDYMVMEHVDGKTLDEMIPRKGMRLNEALKHSVEIADALAKAHAAGIIHRDLKPGNVMVTVEGRVKVLDFGLAKLTEATPPGEDEATRTIKPTTEAGKVVGTVSYMSPEQAEGRVVDARSDIFSFGSLLYEMVAGRRAFQGNSKVATLAAIIKEEPAALAAEVPHDLQKLITRCLRNDPERRFQHMKDLKVELAELKEESDSGTLASSPAGSSRKRRHWGLAAAVAVVALGVSGWLWRTSRQGQSQPVPREVPFAAEEGSEVSGAFSPDGTTVAFMKYADAESGDAESAEPSILLKMIGTDATQVLKKGALWPVWSPDGRWLAYLRWTWRQYWDPASICVMPRIGGAERQIAAVRMNRYPDRLVAWSRDGKWLIATDQEGPGKPFYLALLSIESDEKVRLTNPPQGSFGDTGPALSPDGRTLAFTRHSVWGQSDLHLLSVDANLRAASGPRLLKTGVPNANAAVWTPDGKEIVFCSRLWHAATLWRIRADGSGKAQPLPFGGRGAYFPDISRTGSRLVYTKHIWDANIWRVELDSSGVAARAPERFISSSLGDFGAMWSPDGKWIAFGSERSGTRDVWVCDASGVNARQLTSVDSSWGMVPYLSPNGQWIAFEADVEGNQEIYVIRAGGGRHRRLTSDPANDYNPRWSADGRCILFYSNRGGRTGVWKVALEGGDPIAVQGERPGRYGPGREALYYSLSSGTTYVLWKQPVSGGAPEKVLDGMALGAFAVSQRGVYFTAPGPESSGWNKITIVFHELATGKRTKIADLRPGNSSGAHYSLSPDGRYLLYTQCDRETDDLMLVENFR